MTDLTPENNYQFPPTPAPAELGRDAWNAVMGSVAARIVALEAKRTELLDLISDLSFNGQARIDEAISPLIEAQQLELESLSLAVQQAVSDATNAGMSVAAEVELQVGILEGRVEAVEAAMADILAGTMPATNVVETAGRVFVTPEEKREIDQLRTDLGFLGAGVTAGMNDRYTKGEVNTLTALVGRLPRVYRPSNTALVDDDAGQVFEVDGAFIQTFESALDLSAGWFVYIRNVGAGLITLDPQGSQTIDGALSYALLPGETVIVQRTSDSAFAITMRSNSRSVGRIKIGNPIVVSSPTAAVDILFPVGFKDFEIEFEGVLGDSGTRILQIQVSSDGGSSFSVANTQSSLIVTNTASPTAVSANGGTLFSLTSVGMPVEYGGGTGYLRAFSPHSASSTFFEGLTMVRTTATSVYRAILNAVHTPSISVNAIRFRLDSGNLTVGRFQLFGVRE